MNKGQLRDLENHIDVNDIQPIPRWQAILFGWAKYRAGYGILLFVIVVFLFGAWIQTW